MSSTRRILIVDDDPQIREVLRFALQKEGLETVEASDGAEALRVFEETRPDLVVLDILMPEMDGTEVCRSLRSRSSVPIILLTSKDDEVDRIVGLELGADDYVVKPFSPKELAARVRAVLRRVPERREHGGAGPGETLRALSHGKVKLDLDTYVASWSGRSVPLTVTEFGLLRALLSYPGKVYTREELMQKAYAGETVVSDRTIDSHIRRIRRKFLEAGGDPIQTVHGLGYRVGPCV